MKSSTIAMLASLLPRAYALATSAGGRPIFTRLAASASTTTTEANSITEKMRIESETEYTKLETYYRKQKETDATAEIPILWGSKEEVASFLDDKIDTVMFDCDGVVYRAPDQAPEASECIQTLLDLNKKVFFVTNNAGSNRSQLREKLINILGIDELTEEMMVSSSYSSAQYLKKKLLDTKGSGRLYVIGSPGLCEELRQTGFEVFGGPSDDKPSMTRDELADYPFPEHPIDGVVVGHDIDFNFRKMCIANVLLQMNPDATLVATNKDSHDLVGADARHIPGNGGVVAALEFTSKRTAINTGKPSQELTDLIASEHGIDPSRCLFVGDRLDTDVRFGLDSGMYSVLVMTGVTSADKMIALGSGTHEEPLPSIVMPHIGLMAR